jgi:hypothetical protein
VIFLLMGLGVLVLTLWSVVSTPRVVARTCPRVWLWWAAWLCVGAIGSSALIREGFEAMGWWQ